jgi:hypothetical protein
VSDERIIEHIVELVEKKAAEIDAMNAEAALRAAE